MSRTATRDHHVMPNSNDPTEADRLKAERRTEMRSILAAMDPDERRKASSAACERLVGLDAFRRASVVMLYMSLPTEIDTTAAAIRCYQLGKTVCVPRVDWSKRDMHAVDVASFDDHAMATDDHGIRTPVDGRIVVPTSVDLIVVPALAYDTAGQRLGRGGGYYDRFLPRLRRGATKVGFAFDAQMIDSVPTGELDVRVDIVVTDRRVTKVRRQRARG